MIIDKPQEHHIPLLRQLWQQAFGDTDRFLDSFFETGFSFDRCRCLLEEDTPLAALYWFDCSCQGKKLAYLYAIATREDCRGYGLCRVLIENTHLHLKLQGYAGTVLVPGTPGLADMYQKLGYAPFCYAHTETVEADAAPGSIAPIDPSAFDTLRRQYLPENSVLQEGQTTAFLATFCALYRGEGCLFCAVREEESVYIREFLGDTAALPGVIAALQASAAQVRLPGKEVFGMFHPLTPETAPPAYLGLALD